MEIANKTAVTIGNFDGVHKGHRLLLQTLANEAKEKGLTPVVYTFLSHPINVLKGQTALKSICTNDEKTKLFSFYGIDEVLFEDFSKVAHLSPDEFVKQILVDKLNVKLAVVGENNRFGAGGKGDSTLLKKLGEQYGFDVLVVKPLEMEGVICSSTEVRKAIKQGDVKKANRLLGRNFSLTDTVIGGKHLGHTLGFPTANFEIDATRLLPKYGVYATTAVIAGKQYPAITNVGTTSFDKVKIERVETHIIDFNGDLYGKPISVLFLDHMRSFVPLKSVEDLEAQLIKDREARMNLTEERI